MDLMKLGAQLLKDNIGTEVNEESAGSALSELLGDGKGGLDLSGLISKMTGSETGDDFTKLATSWLGNGDNEGISITQIVELFDGERIAQFASKLNLDKDAASGFLQKALPQLVDKGSADGSLLDAGDLMKMVGNFIK